MIAIIVAGLGFVLDHVLVKEGLPRFEMLIISNSLTGLFAGKCEFRAFLVMPGRGI